MKASEAEIGTEETDGADVNAGGPNAETAGAAGDGVNAGAEIEREDIGKTGTG